MRILGKILLFFFTVILVILLFVVLHFQISPRTGSNPEGERLERLKTSDHYRDGKFHNLEETPMDIPLRTIAAVIFEGIFGTGGGREPEETIPTIAFDRHAWDLVPDTSYAIAWFGHSTVMIKLEGTTILCDPVFGERASAFSFAGPKRFPYTHHHSLNELPHVDVVLQSHDHYDHLDHHAVKGLKEKVAQWLMPLGVGAHLEDWGVQEDRIHEFDLWQGMEVDDIRFDLVPSRHFSGRGLTNRYSTLWGGWVLKGRRYTIFFGGDSGYGTHYKEIGGRHGPFDLVMLECGAYNENWANIHMMPEQLPHAARDLNAKVLMPIHWGKFDLALHPWKEPIERLSAAVSDHPVRLFTPRPGVISMDASPADAEQWWTRLK